MTYTVLVRLDYIDRRGTAHRAEPGETIDNLPKQSIPWLLEQGAIVVAQMTSPQEQPDDGT